MSRHDSTAIRPGRPSEIAPDETDLLHALTTDPDGLFVAAAPEGPPLGRAAGVARGETLQIVHLQVEPLSRGRGIGRDLFEAVRAYGASRGAHHVEVFAPAEPSAAGFLLRRGLPVRALVTKLQTSGGGAPERVPGELQPVPLGAGLTGWVADLDRATRGFARLPEWSRWIRAKEEVLALKRRGRPEGIGALIRRQGAGLIGPVSALSPGAAADLLGLMTGRARAAKLSPIALAVPAEARSLLLAAFSLGYRASGLFLLFGGSRSGDLRRYAGSVTPFF